MKHLKYILSIAIIAALMALTAAHASAMLPVRPTATLAEGITHGVGAVSWSPDTQRIAYITDSLTIINTSDLTSNIVEGTVKTSIKSPIKGAYFVRWIDSDTLLALRREGGLAYVVRLNGKGTVMDETVLPMIPDAAYPTNGYKQLLLVSDSSMDMKIGVRTISTLHVMDTLTAEYIEAYKTERIHPRSLKGTGFIMGWSGAGPSPLDNSMLLITYKDPPALNPYSKASVVDYLTGKRRDIYRSPAKRLIPGASWSPKGDRVAVPGIEGSLRLMGRNGITLTLDEIIKGTHVSWSPTGSRMCFGGVLMYTDGSARRKLVDSDMLSRCFWAPRGRKVAVLSDGTLRLYSDPMDRELGRDALRPGHYSISKIKVLRDLLREKLIDKDEYSKRFRKVMGYPKDSK